MGTDPYSPTDRVGPDDEPPSSARWMLVVVVDNEVSHHELPAQGPVSLGRGEEAAIRVAHRSVSRLHAIVHVMGDKLLLEDLGSANGTKFRGVALERGAPVPITRGEAFELGTVPVMIHRAGSPAIPVAGNTDLERTLARVAQGSISVLLVGETGAGKEVFARRLHAESKRADKPLLALNCAGFSETLLESELFGHEKGAFTGAVARKPGLLETAHGGTVFLDEVGELPLATQAKLLRVLEDKKVTPIGAVTPITVDMRFISATNRNLEAEIEAGRFRRDLFFRLAAITLALPPLRERVAEIVPLAEQFLAEAAARDGRKAPSLTKTAKSALEKHSWPGNVRELKNTIERVFLLTDSTTIASGDLQFESAFEKPAIGLRDDVGSYELERIKTAIEQCGGNQSKAAKQLGISRRTLVDRLMRAGLTKARKK